MITRKKDGSFEVKCDSCECSLYTDETPRTHEDALSYACDEHWASVYVGKEWQLICSGCLSTFTRDGMSKRTSNPILTAQETLYQSAAEQFSDDYKPRKFMSETQARCPSCGEKFEIGRKIVTRELFVSPQMETGRTRTNEITSGPK